MSSTIPVPDETWMRRCFDLASRGLGYVSPNPPVGAVLVYRDRILAEGYHRQFGGPHAEVEAVRNVPDHLRHLVPLSTLYISLEPCCVYGKTPPCTELILKEGIKDVRTSTRDPNPGVAGKSVEILRTAGVSVTEEILPQEGRHLLRSFRTNILRNRPHIVLKWAQSKWGYTGVKGNQVWLSHKDVRVWTHRQRAETDAIMVGAGTVATDDPSLTTRDYPGRSAQRIIVDPAAKLNSGYAVFARDGRDVWYFSLQGNPGIRGDHIRQHLIPNMEDLFPGMMNTLFENRIGYILVEGGAWLQHQLIERNLWDEAWVIQTGHEQDHGIRAPSVWGRFLDKTVSGTDTIIGIENTSR